jgi:hypothetical protein
MSTDPRIQRLAGEAQDAADAFDPRETITAGIDCDRQQAVVTITGAAIDGRRRYSVTANAFLSLDHIDELVRALLVTRADLVKLMAKKEQGQ